MKKKGMVKGHGTPKGTKVKSKLPNAITKSGKKEAGVRTGHHQAKPNYQADTDKQGKASGPSETGTTQQSAYRRDSALTG